MLRLINVHKIYNSGEVKTHALRGISLSISKGEFVAILGPSGSGKSTLLHIIGLLDFPTKGKVLLKNRDVSTLSEDEAAEIRGNEIGFVFQSFNLIPSLTALENVMLPMLIYDFDEEEARQRALELLRRFGLEDRAKHKPNQLSGGQQQRVAIARALAMNPSFILADEPTGNLDSKTGKEVISALRELHDEGRTIVMVTHDSNLTRYAERIIFIKDGKIEKEVKK